jgi:GNAT superfamily N-acetyltransferase
LSELCSPSQDWIGDRWVLQEARGRGVGKTLLSEGESEIAGRGFETMRLRVVRSNRKAVNFYRRNGWRQVREFPHEKLPVVMIEVAKSIQESHQ